MILDTLQQASRYDALHPLFPLAAATLLGPGIASMSAGRYPLRGEDCALVIARDAGRGTQGAVLESHRRFIDVQLVLEGTDLIGWRPVADCASIVRPYDAAGDVVLYGDAPLTWCSVGGPLFAVFFPGDAHAPLGGSGALHRAVIKIRI